MKISIISPVYNKIDKVKFCFEQNLNHAVHKHEWLIIDNNSDTPTKQGLEQLKAKAVKEGHDFHIYTQPYNTGVSVAWNIGLRLVSGDYICILNNDCFMMPAWDQQLVASLNKHDLDLMSPLFVEPRHFKENYTEKDFLYGNKSWERLVAANKGRMRPGLFGGVVLFGPRKNFENIGPFDERFWLSLEEMDYLVRAERKGMKVGMAGDVVAFHFMGLTRHTMHTDKGVANQRYFQRKWGWNFESNEHTFINKWIRRWRRFLWKNYLKMAETNMRFPRAIPWKQQNS